jgi:hypothetical protein
MICFYFIIIIIIIRPGRPSDYYIVVYKVETGHLLAQLRDQKRKKIYGYNLETETEHLLAQLRDQIIINF